MNKLLLSLFAVLSLCTMASSAQAQGWGHHRGGWGGERGYDRGYNGYGRGYESPRDWRREERREWRGNEGYGRGYRWYR